MNQRKTEDPQLFESICELHWMDERLSEDAADCDGLGLPYVLQRERQRVTLNLEAAEELFGRELTHEEVSGNTAARQRVMEFDFTSTTGYRWRPFGKATH